jgi:hypothetical protein
MAKNDMDRGFYFGIILGVAAIAVLFLASQSCNQRAEAAPLNPRADVNQDGCVDANDLLEVRRPGNWGECVATPPPARKVVSYSGPAKSTAYDITYGGRVLENLDIRSNQRAIVADVFWAKRGAYGLTIRDCTIESVDYGLYTGFSGVTVQRTTIRTTGGSIVRVTDGVGVLFEDCTFTSGAADTAVRVCNGRDITFRRCKFIGCRPYGLDIREQYRGEGGCPRDVLLEDCEFIASADTIHAVRIAGQGVRLVRCRGLGFDKALSGATFATVEKHSCDPTGAVLGGCSVDGGKPLLKSKWTDTEVKP